MSAQASATPLLALPAQHATVDYTEAIAYWCPQVAGTELSDAKAARYQPFKQQFLRPVTDVCWFKLQVQSDADQTMTWIFANHWTPIDTLDAWVVSSQDTRHFALGDHRPYPMRVIKSRLPAFPVVLAPHAQASIYLRANTMSLITVIGAFSQERAFTDNEKLADIGSGVFFGLLSMMALMALLIGLWVKDYGMLGYSAYVASFMCICFALLGYADIVLSHPYFAVSDIVVGVFSLTLMSSSTWMWIHLLQLQQHNPSIYRFYKGIQIATILALPLVFSPFYAEMHSVLRTLSFPLNVISPVLLCILWRREKKTEHLIYLLSFTGLLLSSLVYISMTQNLLPLTLHKAYLYMVMLLINILIMSVGMAFRVRQIQLDKIEADNKVALTMQRTQDERRFVAMLSHEFRNPLAAIDRSTQMLMLTNPEIKQASLTRFNNIRASVSRLSSLVDNFLISERIQEGRLSLTVLPHASIDLIEEIRTHFTDDDWQRIHVESINCVCDFDLNLISMAVGNLIHNALRYALPDSVIQLKTSIQHNTLSILVADEGPGIADEEMQMLGTPYFRAASAFGKKGTGLGYYFCRRIVELHGGQLTATKNHAGGLNVLIVLTQP